MKGEYLFKLSERDLRTLLEDLVELLSLLVVGHEADHLENGVKSVSVKLLFAGIATFELENLSEVLVLDIVHASAA